jgi:condensin complex subunit 3
MKIFITAFDLVTRVYEELDDDQEMITPYQFGLLMIDWTNPQKASGM